MSNFPSNPFAILKIKDFLYFIFARFFLTIAIQMKSVIVGWQVYEFTKDPLALGMIGLTEVIPYLLTVLFAGHIADIIKRKKIIITAISVLTVCFFALFYFTLNSSALLKQYGPTPIYCTIFIAGIAKAFIGPSFFALLSQLVPKELLARASTLNTTVWQIAAVAGPALAGIAYGYFGVTFSYELVLACMLIGLISVSFLPDTPIAVTKSTDSIFASINSGIKFVFNNQIILGALSLDLFAVLFGGAVAMLPIFADQVLHTGPEGLGLMRAAPAFGAVITAIIMAYKPPLKNAGKNLFMAVAGFGLCIILFAISKNIYLSIFALMMSGALDNISVVIRHTIVQTSTPDEMRGRVSAVNFIFIGSSNEIGEFESGVAAKLMGLIPSVVFGGMMTMAVVGVVMKKAPLLRALSLK